MTTLSIAQGRPPRRVGLGWAFFERQANLWKRYWAWEVVWLLYGDVTLFVLSIVAEMVQYNGHTLSAHGLGAFIDTATASGDYHAILAGILVMSVYVVVVNTIFWRRLYRLAETRYSLG